MSKKMQVGTIAPDFTLEDSRGRTVRLPDYRGNKHVFLVFNRGFM
jgi:peroxiredoxin